MEFRAPTIANQQNADAMSYLTKGLSDREAGRLQVEELIADLGNSTDSFPDWHPILTVPTQHEHRRVSSLSQVNAYRGIDHTVGFVRGFVTCPYSSEVADKLVEAVNAIRGLRAYRLKTSLYMDKTSPVVVEAINVELDADGTIKGRDVLAWFVRQTASEAFSSQVAETWWTLRSSLLGAPRGSRSSLFVSQHTGLHMRKILEAMNNSGMFGDVKEWSLDMLSPRKRKAISETIIKTAVDKWDKKSSSYIFEMRGETCKATVRDTWDDNEELSVRVEVGDEDLFVSGFYYPSDSRITHSEPHGKRELAEKFM